MWTNYSVPSSSMISSTKFDLPAIDYSIAPAEIQPRGMHPHVYLSQNKLNAYSCFYASSIAACADAFKWTKEDKPKIAECIREGWARVVEEGKFIQGFGGYFSDGAVYAAGIWNEYFPEKRIQPYCVKVNSPEWIEAVRLNWTPTLGRKLDANSNNDLMDDGVVNQDELSGETWGHLVRYGLAKAQPMRSKITDDTTAYCLDNYPNDENYRNIYKLDDFENKLEKELIYKYSFLFLPA